MRRSLFALGIFGLFIVGLGLFAPKKKGADESLVMDKPIACALCGSLLWDGANRHTCPEAGHSPIDP